MGSRSFDRGARVARSRQDTWVGNASANWADSNWSGANNPPLSGDALSFVAAGSFGAALNNNLTTGAGWTVAGITFNSGASAYTITDTLGGVAYTLTSGINNQSSSAQAINEAIALSGVDTMTLTTGGGNLSLGGILSASGSITTAGAGSLTLSGANIYSGGTTIAAGTTLDFNNAAAIGTGALTLQSGAAIDNTTFGTITNSNNNTQTWNGGFTYGGTQSLNLGTGAVTLGSATTITTGGTGTLTEGGAIGGAFGLTMAGTGSLVLSGVVGTGAGTVSVTGGTLTLSNAGNTYTGATSISGGTLSVGNVVVASSKSGLGNATSAVALSGGGDLSYTGSSATYTRRLHDRRRRRRSRCDDIGSDTHH